MYSLHRDKALANFIYMNYNVFTHRAHMLCFVALDGIPDC